MIRWLLLPTLTGVCLAQDPMAPRSAIEPHAANAAALLAPNTKASPPALLTTSEWTDWNDTAPYAEAVEISRRLECASRFVNGAFTPEAAWLRDCFVTDLNKRIPADGHMAGEL
jgi:hypothetical protein